MRINKRSLALGLSVVLALALAVPALGGPSNPVATLSKKAKVTAAQALKAARRAQKTANTAQSTANTALSTANTAKTNAATAQTTADNALTAANNAQATANSKVSDAGQIANGTSVAGSASGVFAGATCPSGAKVTGGGFVGNGTDQNQVTVTERTEFYTNSWLVFARDQAGQAGTSWTVAANGTCATSP